MSEAHFFHATLHRFTNDAVQEITRRFKSRVTDLNTRVWYSPGQAFFQLKCPTDVGPEADVALGEIIQNYIKDDVPQAIERGNPPPVQLFSEAEKDPTSDRENVTRPIEKTIGLPQLTRTMRPPRFVIAGDLISEPQGRMRRIRSLANTSFDLIPMHNLPAEILQRVLTSSKPKDHRRVHLGAVLCQVHYDQQRDRTITLGKTKVPKADRQALQLVETIGHFPRLRGLGVGEDALPVVCASGEKSGGGNTMARFLADDTAEMQDPEEESAMPNDATDFNKGPDLVPKTGRRRVAKIDISDLLSFEDSEDESEQEDAVNVSAKMDAFQSLLAGRVPRESPKKDIANGGANVLASTALGKIERIEDMSLESSTEVTTTIPEYDPKFGQVNRRGQLAADPKTQALWNHEHYDPSKDTLSIAGPSILLRSKRSDWSAQDHMRLAQSNTARATPDSNNAIAEDAPAWERRLVRPKIKTGLLVDVTHEDSECQGTTSADGAQSVSSKVDIMSLLMDTSKDATPFFAPPSSHSDSIAERLQADIPPDRTFNTMNQQAGKKKKRGKSTVQATPAQLPLPDPVPAPRTRESGRKTKSNTPAPDAEPLSEQDDGKPMTKEEVDEALSAPPSLTSLSPFLAALMHNHTRIEVTFGIAPLIRKAQEPTVYPIEQGPGWWQRTLNKDAHLFRPNFIPRLTSSAEDAAWLLKLSKAETIAAEPAYIIRTRSAVTGKLENHYVYPPLKSGNSSESRIQTYDETALGYIHYPKMLWDAMISAPMGEKVSEDIKSLVASMQTRGEPPSFFAKVPEAYSEVVEVQARREFEVMMMKGTYLVVAEVQELQIVPVKSPHFNIAAQCESRQQMVDDQRLYFEAKLIFEEIPPAGARMVEYLIHELSGCMDVIGLRNEGPWMSTGPQEAKEVPPQTAESIW